MLSPKEFIDEAVQKIKDQIGDEKAIIALSGGVDSSVCSVLAQKAVGDNLTAIFVDHGLLRYTFDSAEKGRLTRSGSLGLATCYKFEFLMHSANKTQLVARFITGYANFSLAKTGNVTNNLTECTVESDFYGAGCQGKVDGTVTSTLTNCTIKRNAFGGGYKATSNKVEVYPAEAPTLSEYIGETGIFSEFGKKTPNIFTWIQGTSSKQNTYDDCDSDGQGGNLYTSENITMSDLGNVTGDISLTIYGGYVGGTAQGATPEETTATETIPEGGSVYGGGNESKSLSSATVILKSDAVVYGNVYGGGNKADVNGSATVNIQE